MRDAAAALRSAGVKAIYLAGSSIGLDTLGVLADLARIFPSARDDVRRVSRRIVAEMGGELGTFGDRYALTLESTLHETGGVNIPVDLFHWSGENHHIGRADGAVRLIDALASLDCEPGDRVLLWGHGHAGNVFALATNLLSGDSEAVESFFRAAEIYYRLPGFGWIDIPVWNRVRRMLLGHAAVVTNLRLDIVTFGTPVRYGWDCGGYASLLHFIHRRPAANCPIHRAGFPIDCDAVLRGAEGDYVQQLGIAGTNTAPSRFAWRAYVADRRLGALLQPCEPRGSQPDSFRAGTIVPEEGATLLVDYGLPAGGVGRHLAGHAVYARPKWLLFHVEQVVRRLYGRRACRAA